MDNSMAKAKKLKKKESSKSRVAIRTFLFNFKKIANNLSKFFRE